MPLGGLLPYNDETDPLGRVRALLGGGGQRDDELDMGSFARGGREVPRPTAVGVRAPTQPTAKPGFDWEGLVTSVLGGLTAGRAIRSGDSNGLTNLLMMLAEAKERKRRTALAEEAQRLREEREGRLMEQFTERENRLRFNEEQDRARQTEIDAATRRKDISSTYGQIEDDARTMFTASRPEGAPLEEYITQQSTRFGDAGGDPQRIRAALMALATMAQNRPEVPYIEREPGTPAPATVPQGAVVRNAPRPPAPRRPTTRSYTTTDADGTIYRIVEDDQGDEISRRPIGSKPAGKKDPIQDLIDAAAGGGTAPTPAPPPAGGMVKMRAPDGRILNVPQAQVPEALRRGATRVE